MACCQVDWSTPWGGPRTAAGAAVSSTPLAFRQSESDPCAAGDSDVGEEVPDSDGADVDEHAAANMTAAAGSIHRIRVIR